MKMKVLIVSFLASVVGCAGAGLDLQYVERNRQDIEIRRPYDQQFIAQNPGTKADGLARIDRVREAYQSAAERSTTQPSK